MLVYSSLSATSCFRYNVTAQSPGHQRGNSQHSPSAYLESAGEQDTSLVGVAKHLVLNGELQSSATRIHICHVPVSVEAEHGCLQGIGVLSGSWLHSWALGEDLLKGRLWCSHWQARASSSPSLALGGHSCSCMCHVAVCGERE